MLTKKCSESRIYCTAGHPNPRFKDEMEAEHCIKFGHSICFTSSNYKIVTCPSNEWSIADLNKLENADMRHERRIPKIDDLMDHAIAKQSQLKKFEVLAVVLYTGPMVCVFILPKFRFNNKYKYLLFSSSVCDLQYHIASISFQNL